MNYRRPISLATVAALIVALLYPIPLHSCEGLTGGLISLLSKAAASEGEISCCGESVAACACVTHGGRSRSASRGKSVAAPAGVGALLGDAVGCGCVAIPHIAIQSAVLSTTVPLPHPAVIPSFATLPSVLGFSPAGETSFKIGASPPFLATISHYTYLRTSALLI